MPTTKKFTDKTVTYNDDQATKDALFEKLLNWFFEQETFSGESIMQSDGPLLESPVLLSDIADDILQFDVTWKGE